MKDQNRIYQMAARLDARLKNFAEDPDQRAAQVIAGTAVSGGVGYGAYRGGKALRNKVINDAGAIDDYGNMVARKGMYKDAGKKMVTASKKKIKDGARDAAGNVMGKTSGLLRKAAAGIARGRGKMYGLASGEEERNIGGNVAIGAGAAGVGAAGYQYGKNLRNSNKTYAKLANHGLKGDFWKTKTPKMDAAKMTYEQGKKALLKSKGKIAGGLASGIAKGRKLIGLASLEKAVIELGARMDQRNFSTPYTESIARANASDKKLRDESYNTRGMVIGAGAGAVGAGGYAATKALKAAKAAGSGPMAVMKNKEARKALLKRVGSKYTGHGALGGLAAGALIGANIRRKEK